jgi:FAD/FMN-containing dehydrogenase
LKREGSVRRSRYEEDRKRRRIVKIPVKHESDPVNNLPENLEKARDLLREALGSEWVSDDPAITCGYARDQSFTPAIYPHIVALPASTEEVAEIFRIANRCKVDVMPYGTGVSTVGATIPLYGGIICDLRRMDQILEIDGRRMQARIQPGVTYVMLQAEAQRRDLRLTNPSTSATAGVISNHTMCNINTMSCKYGFGMDNILEFVMVLPTGEILEAGPRACGMQAAHVPGPGPDLSSYFRYSMGTMGIVTEMTVRLYPEPRFLHQLYPAYDEDHLDDIIEALYRIARDNMALELAHLQNTFYGIFIGDDNKETERLVKAMPRNNIMAFFGGSTKEEAVLKAELSRRVVAEVSPKFDFIDAEIMYDLAGNKVKLDRWTKYFRETVRVQRVRGSFYIGALIDRLDNFLGTEQAMRVITTDQVGTNDEVLRPDDASAYFQPYHMGRMAYLEFDLYSNQADKDDLLRVLFGYLRASFGGMGRGALFAAGAACMIMGMPMLDMALPMMMPTFMPYLDTVIALKKETDPNNICNRRWDYESGEMKKLALF